MQDRLTLAARLESALVLILQDRLTSAARLESVLVPILQDRLTSAARFESVLVPIPCILIDLDLTEVIITKIMEQASNKCHSNKHGYGYLRIQELIH